MAERPPRLPERTPVAPSFATPAPRLSQVPSLSRLLALLAFMLALPAFTFAFWWMPVQAVEDSLPESASSAARTTAALCDRGAEGWCYGLAFMYACADEGLTFNLERAAELEQLECEVDPSHCQASETMIGEWHTVGSDMQMFSCRRNRIDTAQGLQALPDFMERAGDVVAPPVFAAELE